MKLKSIFILLILTVLFEIGVITYLTTTIHKKVLGVSSITPLNRDDLVFSNEGELKYFYEPESNTKIENILYWASKSEQVDIKTVNTINSDSLNERYDYPTEKPKDTFRIITLGDSHTYGVYVNTKDNYPEKLEDLLNNNLKCQNIKKFEVINLGESGYDIKYTVERYKKRGQKYNPDLVLWLIKSGDLSKINEIFKERMLNFDRQFKENLLDKTNYVRIFQEIREQTEKEMGDEKMFEYQLKALKDLEQHLDSSKLIFMASPNYTMPKEKNIFEQLVNGSNNVFLSLNIDPAITNEDNIVKAGDLHPNKKGYKLISQSIFNYLVKSGQISCK